MYQKGTPGLPEIRRDACRGRRGSWARRYDYEDPLKAAEREERDRRRAEVRRYPIDDTELHAELRDKAFPEGASPGVSSSQDFPVAGS